MAVQTLPVNIDLTVYAGTTFRRSFRWKPGGTPQDFTGWTAQFRVGPTQGTATTTLTETSGIILDSDGTFTISMTPSATRAMKAGSWFYILDMTDSTATVLRLLRGRLSVVRDLEPA